MVAKRGDLEVTLELVGEMEDKLPSGAVVQLGSAGLGMENLQARHLVSGG